MAVKFKRLKIGHSCATRRGIATSQGGYETDEYCWEIETPIREWGFAPQQLVIRWAENNPIPTSELVTITFAEVEKSVDLQATNFYYIIKKDAVGGYTYADVIELHSTTGENLKKLPVKADGKVSFRVSFKNFHLLKNGDNPIQLYLGIIGTNEKGEEVEIEKRPYSIIIKKVAENEVTSPYITTDKGDFHRNVSVNVVVKKDIENALDEINFCLDKKKILVRKHKAECQFLKAHFVMSFEGYGKAAHTIEQTYEYVFFNDEVTLFPGEEVQDFFPEIPDMEALKINENGFISPQNLFKTCQTQITLSQYDDKGTIHKTEKLPTLYFLPGRKPLAYPYLTNCITRRTFSSSLITLCALQEDFLNKDLGKIAGNLVDVSAITTPKMVVNLSFRRSLADKTFGEKNLIKKEKLELLPITNPQKVIDVLFQNQNLCPDWLSFSGEWERHEDFTHTLSENMKNGKTFKAHSEQKTTLKLNTGWLLEEEIPLLNELILSPVCFIKGIEEPGGNNTSQWIRAIAVNKKSLVYDNLHNVRSFVVEFVLPNPSEGGAL